MAWPLCLHWLSSVQEIFQATNSMPCSFRLVNAIYPCFKDNFLALYVGWVKLFFKYIYLNPINSSIKCSSGRKEYMYLVAFIVYIVLSFYLLAVKLTKENKTWRIAQRAWGIFYLKVSANSLLESLTESTLFFHR